MKMRFITVLLLVAFAFQIPEFLPAKNHLNPNTCCGRLVCSCTHPKGSFCPFRHQMEPEVQDLAKNTQYKHCDLPHLQKEEMMKSVKDLFDKSSAPRFLFTKAPCATDTPKVTSSGYSRDFELVLSPEYSFNHKIEFLSRPFFKIPRSFESLGIDRPPRFF